MCIHDSHVAGWNLQHPVFEALLERGERLMQFVSNASVESPLQQTGNYFTWAGGHGMGACGVGSGLAGRTRNTFLVVRPVLALFGTAAPIPHRTGAASGFALRGRGGADQIFIADRGLSSLVPGNSSLEDF